LNFLEPSSTERGFLIELCLFLVGGHSFLPEKRDLFVSFCARVGRSACFDVAFAGVGSALSILPEKPDFSPELCEFLLDFYGQALNTRRIFRIFNFWFESVEPILGPFLDMLRPLEGEICDFVWASDVPEHQLFAMYFELARDVCLSG
jgi:hypothetical protein